MSLYIMTLPLTAHLCAHCWSVQAYVHVEHHIKLCANVCSMQHVGNFEFFTTKTSHLHVVKQSPHRNLHNWLHVNMMFLLWRIQNTLLSDDPLWSLDPNNLPLHPGQQVDEFSKLLLQEYWFLDWQSVSSSCFKIAYMYIYIVCW